jgi:hypothetical protein
MWEEKRVCPFHHKKGVGELLMSIFCCYFESLRRRENKLEKAREKEGGNLLEEMKIIKL